METENDRSDEPGRRSGQPPTGPPEQEAASRIVVPGKKGQPPGRSPGRWLRRLAMGVGVLVLAVAIIVMIPRWADDGAGAEGSASPGDTPAATEDRDGGDGAGTARYARLAESLATRLQQYEERERDFQAGRIGCAELSRGYQSVDESYLELLLMHGRVEGELDSAARERHEDLVDETDGVNRHFDRSGCERPD